jgi:hypothetical protein
LTIKVNSELVNAFVEPIGERAALVMMTGHSEANLLAEVFYLHKSRVLNLQSKVLIACCALLIVLPQAAIPQPQ